jgi:surface protein
MLMNAKSLMPSHVMQELEVKSVKDAAQEDVCCPNVVASVDGYDDTRIHSVESELNNSVSGTSPNNNLDDKILAQEIIDDMPNQLNAVSFENNEAIIPKVKVIRSQPNNNERPMNFRQNQEQDFLHYKHQSQEVLCKQSYLDINQQLERTNMTHPRFTSSKNSNKTQASRQPTTPAMIPRREKPGAIAVPGIEALGRYHQAITTDTSGIAPTIGTNDEHDNRTIQIGDAIIVANIGIAEPMNIREDDHNEHKTDIVSTNKQRFYSIAIFLCMLSFLLCGAVIMGVCLSGRCQRNTNEQPDLCPTIVREAFETTDELMHEVDKVLSGGTTETLIYGRIEEWNVSRIQNFSSLFSSSRNMDAVAFDRDIHCWNMSSATDASKMFWRAWSFNGSLSKWNMSNVKDMSDMFGGADIFFGIGLDQWNTSRVEKMSGMFAGAREFDANLSRWDVGNVKDMSYMFAETENASPMDIEKADNLRRSFSQFRGVGLDMWNTSQVGNMKAMFDGAMRFDANLSTWDTSQVTDMSLMFREAFNFKGIGLTNWDVSNVTNMNSMFSVAYILLANISSWNTSKVTNMNNMFSGANSFDSDLSLWNTSRVIDMSGMFFGASSFLGIGLEYWIVGNVLDMNNMFNLYSAGYGAPFNGNLSLWDTSKVTDMSFMFHRATSFRGVGLEDWDVSNVRNMEYMFASASLLGANLSSWNTSRVRSMASMFAGASSFNDNVSLWDTAKVTDMSYMFSNTSSFRGIGLTHWNVSKCETMKDMFADATTFDANLTMWDVSNVKDMSRMFYSAESFVGNGLEKWNVSQVRTATFMFANAISFNNGNVSNWDTSNMQNMLKMFFNTTSFHGVSWYNDVLVQRFYLLPTGGLHCKAGIDTVCQASTSYTNSTDTPNFVWDMMLLQADTTNITLHADSWYITRVDEFLLHFSETCSVTCNGDCSCFFNGCHSVVLENVTIVVPP